MANFFNIDTPKTKSCRDLSQTQFESEDIVKNEFQINKFRMLACYVANGRIYNG